MRLFNANTRGVFAIGVEGTMGSLEYYSRGMLYMEISILTCSKFIRGTKIPKDHLLIDN